MPEQGSQFSGIIMMVVLFGLMYFMMIRPQKKKDKQIKEMRNSLTLGDEVITIGGIHGKIVKVNDEVVTLEMSHAKQRIEFSKWAIGSVDKKGKEKAAEVKDVEEETSADEDKDN
ncbi:preprotein translocase subunit YajC [Sedimentibacter hydroxybenzoicus DSM 7310]|uniref:Preprotein translocase subunit YajC n=1 Tax=Sedimentibacter hydroxybenzoicus DSM 7310 TaxID=1123245 RepID=A0A974GXY3_SEDHY|nr:preprotein translocase subunit YajC [Sedimentibacter hydroxybenzoicus]NYB75636.1 preprotein translocase subunit YajC [Sedimentibacter hydroxybenzoicus DSM 7310]